jgi:Trk K+ transport system NAD-binding subunit
VLQLGETMGIILSRRANAGDAYAHVVGRFGDLQIAEVLVTGSSLVGLTLRDTALRQKVGVSVVGVWERGNFQNARPESIISQSTVLVLAGSEQEIELYNKTFGVKRELNAPVLILGAGRVGRATARALSARNLDYRIVDKDPARIKNVKNSIVGDASDMEVLIKAGIRESPCVMITTRDDDVNVYLTIYCRLIRSDIQIITRATSERNLGNLHRAGADFVISYASLGANTILNLLQRSDILMVAEGLDLIKVKIPKQLEGKQIQDTSIRKETGCTIIAIQTGEEMIINPDPSMVLTKDSEIILIGTVEAENQFFEIYAPD